MREKAHVREVGPRDGLQMVGTILPTERKLAWCRRVVAAGIHEIEVTSFVPPKLIPQFGDAEEVARGAMAIAGCRPSALVPNLRGAERAFALGVPQVNYVLSASEQHNLANVRRTTEQSLEDFARIVAARDQRVGAPIALGAGIATAFGCTISGAVSNSRVVEIAGRLAEMGADEITIADTVGYGHPRQVQALMKEVIAAVGQVPVACHFHDTRGLGLANVAAALDAGVRAFDASVAGLGGCPFAPGATGNIDTEDTVFLLEQLGFDTGADVEALVAFRREVETWLPGERFSGAIARAGLPKTYHAHTTAAV
ncbi:hydroxymethylglutaryl-CoA lyase [Bradyrhizobium diazoefficiens]|uniref:Bll6364 protein n=1 Tax=Bradyrhizobium diazoefficiens (strain JCM 10833 / BCRC 13528 / IAM 13628 / NBRC 14792 / USDA 110) TaxID=224911 RepID=Q89GI1_BRADU|nr:hydroxymethylglutaryl-CoA lyase [Bradyrhizobium diazoefficiens]AND91445.1 3-hydroxy-3-methylglutaryl-CoA lyase [Bradyrhizobium diazoefficiens USDA 110]QBP25116.1 hydroxymethylglutaryl-CoA lyase [Bradyrhizobium diazoefficiens]WLB36527.1 hydroxymethylglutaryl-CoA lyase [Bradyrhizobium diazoefficiens]BAC51629.1 bll6364 [Bradyrhizobium diazoefficiens USDA 110]BCF46324.1 hydroxymethylglutaryl-CoA lyase [Bradyrhizobium diazoefficiens]